MSGQSLIVCPDSAPKYSAVPWLDWRASSWDVISGAAKDRKALDQLMNDAKKRKFDIVLVWKFDRFARSLKMLVEFVSTLSRTWH